MIYSKEVSIAELQSGKYEFCMVDNKRNRVELRNTSTKERFFVDRGELLEQYPNVDDFSYIMVA
jgi:hypothetical protein